MPSVDGMLIVGDRTDVPMEPKAAFSGSPHPDQERQVMAAWDRFLRGTEMPPNAVRSVIESSWSRCLSARVDPGRSRAQAPAPEEDLRRLQHRHRDLIDASVPVMQQARDFLSESGTMMILTDPTGVILETEGDQSALDVAQDVRLVSGANKADVLGCVQGGLIPLCFEDHPGRSPGRPPCERGELERARLRHERHWHRSQGG